ncbi:MAG: carbohydrate ABC transporter permease [Proteobacteria bacterium]|nr:carbohydrate ABC transporter permease [Pseudomonadota bacterium]
MSMIWSKWWINGALVAAAALVLFPLAWMLSVSFMQPGTAGSLPPPMLPAHPTLGNYRELFAHAGMGRYFANSVFISTSITLLSLVCNTLAGYAFAKLRFAGREKLFGLLIGGLVIPAQVAMLPLFLLLKYVGLVNTYAGVILPSTATVFGIVGIFLVRQYARGIPDDLLEAARVDGAGELRIFVQIVLPLLKPILVTLAVLTFLTAWNDFMWPLIVLTGQQHYTLPVGLASLSREHVQDFELMMAGAVITVLPVLVLFLALQRYYLRGLLLGSVKG